MSLSFQSSPVAVAGPSQQAAALRDEMVKLTANITTLIAERGGLKTSEVIKLVDAKNYPGLVQQTDFPSTVRDVARAVIEATRQAGSGKTTAGPVVTGAQGDYQRLVAEMSEIVRDLGVRNASQLVNMINLRRSYPNLSFLVQSPRAFLAEVASAVLAGNQAQLTGTFQRYVGERTTGGSTVGIDLGLVKSIADVATSLLPAITKDKKVLQIANLAKSGLGIAASADAGSISNAIQQGTQAAKGALDLFGVRSQDTDRILNAARGLAQVASPFEEAQREAQKFRADLIAQGIPPQRADLLSQQQFQRRLQELTGLRQPQPEPQPQPQPRQQPQPQPQPPQQPGMFQPAPLPGPQQVSPIQPQPPTQRQQPPLQAPPTSQPFQTLPGTNVPMPGGTAQPDMAMVDRLVPAGNGANVQPRAPRGNPVPECDPLKAGPCRQRYSRFGTMESRGQNQSCCRTRPTGRGVIVAEHAGDSDLWPGGFWEAPAGDYYYISCGQAEELTPEFGQIEVPYRRGTEQACLRTGGTGISSMVIPEDWSVKVFSKPNFRGESIELYEGEHNLDALGWGDRVFSMKVRGPWTVVDGLIFEALNRRLDGWATENLRKSPSVRDIVSAILLDPRRPEPPIDFDEDVESYPSSYGQNWKELLRAAKRTMGSRRAQLLRDGFAELGLLD